MYSSRASWNKDHLRETNSMSLCNCHKVNWRGIAAKCNLCNRSINGGIN